MSRPESPVDGLHDWQHADEKHEQIKRQDGGVREAQEEILSRSLKAILTQQQVRNKLSTKHTHTHTKRAGHTLLITTKR